MTVIKPSDRYTTHPHGTESGGEAIADGDLIIIENVSEATADDKVCVTTPEDIMTDSMGAAKAYDRTNNLLADTTWTEGYYLSDGSSHALGEAIASATWKYSGYIPLSGITKFLIDYANKDAELCACVFYSDDAGTAIDKYVPVANAYNVEIPVPASATHMRVNSQRYINEPFCYPQHATKRNPSRFQIEGSAIVNLLNHWKNKKIVWVGTSIPESAKDYVAGSTYNYPAIVGTLLGATVINTSKGGRKLHLNAEPGGATCPYNGGMSNTGSLAMTVAEYIACNSVENCEVGDVAPTWTTENVGYYSFENALIGTLTADADLYVLDWTPNNGNAATTDWDLFDFDTWTWDDFQDGSHPAETEAECWLRHRLTYLGAALFLINEIYENNPNARCVFINYPLAIEVQAAIGTQTELLAATLNIPIINIWEKMQINVKNREQYYVGTDYVHPNVRAHEQIAAMLANEFLLVR